MPRIVNGVIQPSSKKRPYENLENENDIENPLKKCCKCDRSNCINCDYCNQHCMCSCGKCTFIPSMLCTIDAFIGYIFVISCGLMTYFVSWKVGVIVFVICCIGYGFFLNYRCCKADAAHNNLQNEINAANRNRDRNKNRKSGNRIHGISDLPKTNKGG